MPSGLTAVYHAENWSIGLLRKHDSGPCCGCGESALTCSLEALTEAERRLRVHAAQDFSEFEDIETVLSIIRAARRPILDTRAAFRYESQRPDEECGEQGAQP